MKRIILAALLLIPTSIKANINDTNFLKSISEIETGNNNKKVGRSGERSRYQFMRATWMRYTNHPFIHASKNEELATKVALDHLGFIKQELYNAGIEVNVYNCALYWNGGYKAVSRPKLRTIDYAQRTENIYEVLNRDVAFVSND